VKSNPATTELAPQAMLARSAKNVEIARHRAGQLRCHPPLIAMELLMASGAHLLAALVAIDDGRVWQVLNGHSVGTLKSVIDDRAKGDGSCVEDAAKS
jgi:hypothetical protein